MNSNRIIPESELRTKAEAADAAGKAFCASCYCADLACCGYFDECGYEVEFARLLGRTPITERRSATVPLESRTDPDKTRDESGSAQ